MVLGSSSLDKSIFSDSNGSMDSVAWYVMTSKVQDGWATIKGKHPKDPSPYFDMTLRSHLLGSKGKS